MLKNVRLHLRIVVCLVRKLTNTFAEFSVFASCVSICFTGGRKNNDN